MGGVWLLLRQASLRAERWVCGYWRTVDGWGLLGRYAFQQWTTRDIKDTKRMGCYCGECVSFCGERMVLEFMCFLDVVNGFCESGLII